MAKCKGINRKGKKCGSSAIEGSDYCQDHQNQAFQSEDKRPPKQRKPLLKTLWRHLISFFVGLATMFGILSYLQPNISVTPLASLDSSPMSTRFIVTNNGYLFIRDVAYSIALGSVEGSNVLQSETRRVYEKGPQFMLKQQQKRFLHPNQSDTVNIDIKYFRKLMPITKANIGIIVNFRTWYFPFQRKRIYSFFTLKDASGKMHWFPKTLDN
jgi:hypothetical protein